MKTIDELTSASDPAMPLVREWVAASPHPVEVLPPAAERDAVLMNLQVTPRSVLGSIAYETGGVLVDGGWLRLLGSGHPRLTRSLVAWNAGRAQGFLLVADDVAGGFFALNGGGLGADHGKMYYFAPARLAWEPMALEYSQFVAWCCSERLAKYYDDVRWSNWRAEAAALAGDRCCFWFPPRWTTQGKGPRAPRGTIPVAEAWGVSMDIKAQLDGS